MAVASVMLDSSKAQFLCPLFIYLLVHSFVHSAATNSVSVILPVMFQ